MALGKPCGKLKGLHNIFPFNVGIIDQQFFNSLPCTDLGNYPSNGNPCSPDTGFTPHDGGIQAKSLKIFMSQGGESILQKAGQDNAEYGSARMPDASRQSAPLHPKRRPPCMKKPFAPSLAGLVLIRTAMKNRYVYKGQDITVDFWRIV
jgi:hypothetical protein